LAGGSFGDQIIRLPAIARAPLSRVGDVQAVLTPADEVIFHQPDQNPLSRDPLDPTRRLDE
jgi:hypothetical protein